MRKHTKWERQLVRGMLAGPVFALAVVGIVSLYVLFGVVKALSWINGEDRTDR